MPSMCTFRMPCPTRSPKRTVLWTKDRPSLRKLRLDALVLSAGRCADVFVRRRTLSKSECIKFGRLLKLCAGGRHDWQPRDAYLMHGTLALANPGAEVPRDSIKLNEISNVRGTGMGGDADARLGFAGSPQSREAPAAQWEEAILPQPSVPAPSVPSFSFDSVDELHVAPAPSGRLKTPKSPVRLHSRRMSHYHINAGGLIQVETRADSSHGARSFVLSVETEAEVSVRECDRSRQTRETDTE